MFNSPAKWLHQPLAIVGMACRLPGADGLQQFWKLLSGGGYAVERMPDHKLDRELYYDPRKGQRGKTYSQVGGFVTERELDWSLLNIRPEQAGDWDACHLALCETTARACQNAGYDPRNLPQRNVGVFVGHSGGTTLGGDLAYRAMLEDYLKLLTDLPQWQELGSDAILNQLRQQLGSHRPQRVAGGRPFVDAGFASGIISRNFGLTGPHMSIDAACASSLVALAIGAMSLASGQTDMAIIGGASYNKADSLVLFSAAQSCSAQISRPFDQAADGLISSEGYVAILVKRLEQAQAAGDRIHAVIRGIGYSTDGRGRSLWAPRFEGQSTAIERAYPAQVDPASVQLIEAHATSTQVGDDTEMKALAEFYGPRLAADQKRPVGSVKSNIGHTLESAGLTGLIKAVLAIQHGIIPPSINVQQLNQSIQWDKIPFYIPPKAEPWPTLPAGQPRRAAVNAFGIGGLNVHVVVDQAPQEVAATPVNRVETAQQNLPIHVKPADEPIAVIGRGLVVPGANDLTSYIAAMTQVAGGSRSLIHQVEFEYDWRAHKVPPKQVAHANPLQFMLLEAAEQALNEAGLMNKSFDRSHTAVVVGSIFGGDFGNSLFAGLRLPEFRDRLKRTIISHGQSLETANQLAQQYEESFLKHYPALLDETGSFTSSTLASRVAKTFNLMGGAMAIDAGDVSSLAALKTACWLLHSHSVSSVLCAGAQSALDNAAIDNLKSVRESCC
jgi:acyl transferase domain-containing protein